MGSSDLALLKKTRSTSQVNIYLFNLNNKDTKERCKICSKSTIKTPRRRESCRFGVFIVNFEHISHLVLVSLMLTLSNWISTGSGPLQGQTLDLTLMTINNIFFFRHFRQAWWKCDILFLTQLTFTFSNSTIETVEKSVKYVQS